MTELLNPIVGPLRLETPTDGFGFGWDLGGGLSLLVPTSLTEEGSGWQVAGTLYRAPNRRDIFGLGFQLQFDKGEGGDFDYDQSRTRGLLSLIRGEQVPANSEGKVEATRLSTKGIYAGFGKSGEATTIELGSDILAPSLFWRMSGNTGLLIRPSIGLFNSIPFGSDRAEEISILGLRAMLEVRLFSLENSNRPPPEGLTEYDVWYYSALQAHRFGRTHATAKVFTSPSDAAQEVSEDYSLGVGLPTARLEDSGSIIGLGLFGSGQADGEELQLQLKATGDQVSWMAGTKIASTGAYFALGGFDRSPTMFTQGFAGLLELGGWFIGANSGLSLSERRLLNSTSKKKRAENFILYRTLLNLAGFLAGWGGKNEKAGQALLQGSEQAMISVTMTPDPAETGLVRETSGYLVYETTKEEGNYIGFEITNHLSSHLYVNTRLLTQATPGPKVIQDEVIDPTTGRNVLYEGAKARMEAGLGLEFKTGPLTWQAGAQTALAYGEGPQPVPGVGLRQQVLLHLSENVEVGVGLTENWINDKLRLGLSAVGGIRF